MMAMRSAEEMAMARILHFNENIVEGMDVSTGKLYTIHS